MSAMKDWLTKRKSTRAAAAGEVRNFEDSEVKKSMYEYAMIANRRRTEMGGVMVAFKISPWLTVYVGGSSQPHLKQGEVWFDEYAATTFAKMWLDEIENEKD